MKLPIIILGAGASYDYSPYPKEQVPPIAPLTDHLIQQDFISSASLYQYKEAADLLSDIAGRVLNQRKSFEEALQDIKNEAGNKRHRRAQFIALEFYLQHLFSEISTKTQPLNNYRILIEKIQDFNEGHAIIITLNYDSLFERNLSNPMQEINDYIKDSLKLIKIHGSHNWNYINNRSYLNYNEYKNDFDFYKENPDIFKDAIQKNITPFHIDEIDKKDKNLQYARFPAIAIPLPSKQNFVCPANHIKELESALQKTDRILIIGWRAGDPSLIELVNNNIHGVVTITIVLADKGHADVVAAKLDTKFKANENINLIFKTFGGGFSSFISSDYIKDFFVVDTDIIK